MWFSKPLLLLEVLFVKLFVICEQKLWCCTTTDKRWRDKWDWTVLRQLPKEAMRQLISLAILNAQNMSLLTEYIFHQHQGEHNGGKCKRCLERLAVGGGGGVAGRWHHGQERRHGVIFPKILKIKHLADDIICEQPPTSVTPQILVCFPKVSDSLVKEDMDRRHLRICAHIWRICGGEGLLVTLEHTWIRVVFTMYVLKRPLNADQKLFGCTPLYSFMAHAELTWHWLDSCWTCWFTVLNPVNCLSNWGSMSSVSSCSVCPSCLPPWLLSSLSSMSSLPMSPSLDPPTWRTST